MPNVSNNIYLELAILDYNNCQALHRLEWEIIRRWYREHNLRELGLRQRSLLRAYFLAAASVFEPERQRERLAWAKTTALIETIASYFGEEESSLSHEQRTLFTLEFHRCFTSHVYLNHQSGLDPTVTRQGPMNSLVATIEQLSLEAFMAHGTDIRHQLCKAWTKWLMAWEEDGDRYWWEAALVVRTVELCGRSCGAEETLRHPEYQRLLGITNRVCHRLGHLQPQKGQHKGKHSMANADIRKVVESDMHELVELVLKHTSGDVDRGTKQMFLTVAKSFYYVACCTSKAVNAHIAKVLFHKVR
ncbi:hypothetical protein Nepgr_004503 [Nepenthes gracilis]|uniref:Terpene synthase metal-binding domain-containing protein n=1 Tax=Nepenthes gracilis TaxID=150966 RepID=A0AAD3S1T5_NEPGR|nr:hypothetical protein Nepgr_004503 [Nepenthes gracilis]